MKKADIGLIGIAVMGQSLALNMESKGFKIAVYDLNPEQTVAAYALTAGSLLGLMPEKKLRRGDATGAIKIQPKFDNILSYFDDHGRAQVVKNGAVGIIGTDSEYIINPQFSSISECYEDGYYVVTVGNTAVGIIDASGKYVVSPRFEN